MTASIDAAKRDVSDPLVSIVDCELDSNLYIVRLSVLENSNTLNHGTTRRFDANSSDLLYLEHP